MLATSTVLRSPPKPGWQTDELEDEWIEPSSESHDAHDHAPHPIPHISHSSFADVPPPSPTLSEHRTPSPTPPGTFLIREDQPAAPILPKPLAKARRKGLIKDFFSPLALETMFEPPSPRVVPEELPIDHSRLEEVHTPGDDRGEEQISALALDEGLGEGDMEEETRPFRNEELGNCAGEEDVILASDIPNLVSFDGRKPSSAYKFTFSAPRSAHLQSPITESASLAAHAPPVTDSRLRLFQFQYDTYTREHLSAMVDSIAVTSSSNANGTTSSTRRQAASTPAAEGNATFLRATKRLRLTPPKNLCNQDPATRPNSRRDYVGESRHLMQKIRQARTPSMMTTLSIKENIQPTDVEDRSTIEERSRRLPLGDLRSAWSTDTPSELSKSALDPNNSKNPSSSLQSSAAYPSSSLHPVYPTSTLTPSIPSSLCSSTSNPQSRPSSAASALGYRRQAADLMAQIRKDVTGGRRLVSLELSKEEVLEKPRSASPVLQRKPSRVTLTSRKDRDASKAKDKPALPLSGKVVRPSPRKLLRRLSAADEIDRELALETSRLDLSLVAVGGSTIDGKHVPEVSLPKIQVLQMSVSPPDPTLSLPQAPTAPGRVVSGGTTTSLASSDTALTRGTSATSVSQASVGSFVKHPGPPQMMRIAPGDVPSLPETVGGMRFDRVLMRWVKGKTGEGDVEGDVEESDDPFRSFESLGSGKVEKVEVRGEQDGPVVDARAETDDSFAFDGEGSAAIVEVMTGVDSQDAETETETTDSEGDDAPRGGSAVEAEELTENETEDEDENVGEEDDVTATIPTPVPAPAPDATPTPTHRDAPPPRSALKNGSTSLAAKPSPAAAAALRTPTNLFRAAHRRSVSFSDGRKDGKIQGLGRADGGEGAGEDGGEFVPSVRGNRIAAILADLVEPSFEEETPSKASAAGSRGRPPGDAIQARRVFARSPKEKEMSLTGANQTFLTECSFGVARERLVQVITDVHPYVPHWETLEEIDLGGRGLESVMRLKELLPRLDALKLDANALGYLSGVPKTVRTLSAGSNVLTAMTSFGHLTNLEYLDISNNQLDSLQQLSCLRHLRELKADGNAITRLDGLEGLDGLTKLSIKGNRLTDINLGEQRWPRIELLNLSRNRLRSVRGLASLASLTALNLDHNRLESLDSEGGTTMVKLRTLRISENRLTSLDAGRFTGLRTLYADNNRLCGLRGAQRLGKLENLSLRNQNGNGLTLATRDIRDIKRLYLSGNPLVSTFIEEPCYNLVYLEVAACRLTGLARDLARLVPNVRVLNLNYNFLGDEDVRALEGLTRVRKLTLIGSRVGSTKALVRMLRRMPELEMLDCRMNPCTLGWYLPILVRDVPGALQPSEEEEEGRDGMRRWAELDAKFRRDLPDAAYVGRLAYRGLVMRWCDKVRMLDGVAVEGREREKAERLLAGVEGGRRSVCIGRG